MLVCVYVWREVKNKLSKEEWNVLDYLDSRTLMLKNEELRNRRKEYFEGLVR